MEDAMSDDVVSAEKAQQVIDAVNAACELGDMSSTEEAAALTMESLAHTVIALHAREAAQATELAVLRAQLPPLLAVHDALVAAAALPGAGASPEAMVAAVRAQGAEAMRATVLSATVLCTRACEASLKSGTMDERIRALLEVVASAHDLWVDLPIPGAEVSRG
jgi:hypothetical protein